VKKSAEVRLLGFNFTALNSVVRPIKLFLVRHMAKKPVYQLFNMSQGVAHATSFSLSICPRGGTMWDISFPYFREKHVSGVGQCETYGFQQNFEPASLNFNLPAGRQVFNF
jgi:hypothetical protein